MVEPSPRDSCAAIGLAAAIDWVEGIGIERIAWVGDRGMIKGQQVEVLTKQGFHYITAITKPQIEKLLRTGTLQMDLFDQEVAEVPHGHLPQEDRDVGDRQVHALGAGGRHDVRGVAGEEQPAEAHRLGDEAAQRRDALLDRRADRHPCGDFRTDPLLELVPESLVAPLIHVIVERALHGIDAGLGEVRQIGLGGRARSSRRRARGWLRNGTRRRAAGRPGLSRLCFDCGHKYSSGERREKYRFEKQSDYLSSAFIYAGCTREADSFPADRCHPFLVAVSIPLSPLRVPWLRQERPGLPKQSWACHIYAESPYVFY